MLPSILLEPLVEMASDRYILEECVCRKAEGCKTYPHEIGCLFLGRGAARIHPTMGRPVGLDEARAHIGRAIQIGLVPLIVHTAFDAYMLGIPFNQMLAICFCCDCCCTVRSSLRLGPPVFWDAVEKLPGLSVIVDESCVGCETCVDLCHVQAIHVQDGMARIGDQCKGCGRCAAACPTGAIHIEVANIPGMTEYVMKRVEQRTNIRRTHESKPGHPPHPTPPEEPDPALFPSDFDRADAAPGHAVRHSVDQHI